MIENRKEGDKMNLWKEQGVISFLQFVLQNARLKQEILPFQKPEETYTTNQYYLFTVIDFIFKYQILHKDQANILAFVAHLQEIISKTVSYREFYTQGMLLLASSIQNTLHLPDLLAPDHKRKVLEYAYQNYIEEGYYFYAFPAMFQEKIKKDGVYPEIKNPFLSQGKEVANLFEKYQGKKILASDSFQEEKDYYEITDSPSFVFFSALEMPSSFCSFVSWDKKKQDSIKHREDYYKRDYDACSRNVENLCNQNNFTMDEKAKVMGYFKESWNYYLGTSSKIPMIWIKRKAIGRNSLKDYDKILKNSDKEPLIVSLAKLLDSRQKKENHYSKLLPKDFILVELPSYQSMLEGKLPPEKVEIPKSPVVSNKDKEVPRVLKNNHGNADVIALFGLLSIALGITLMIFKFYFRIQ